MIGSGIPISIPPRQPSQDGGAFRRSLSLNNGRESMVSNRGRESMVSARNSFISSSEHTEVKPFVMSHGITTAEAEALLIQYGRNELPDDKVPKVSNKVYLCVVGAN
jgi:hypothetical protein